MNESTLLDPPSAAATDKGNRTRVAILEAATRVFSERGYEGTGIRDIEAAADVKRGVVTYHLGNKDDIWKAVFDYTVAPFLEDLESKKELIVALEPEARRRYLIANFIRTSARKPELNSLMLQENQAPTWRIDWILENYLKPMRLLMSEMTADDPAMKDFDENIHLHYTLLGACTLVFSLSREAGSLYGRNVFDEAFVEQHIETVFSLLEKSLGR